MELSELKEKKQREVLKRIGEALIRAAKDDDAESIEVHVATLQEGYLDVLGPEDFFGSEGWEHWIGLD